MIVTLSAVGVMGFSVLAPILPVLQETLGVSEGAVGWLQSTIAVPGVILSLLIGFWSDQTGRKRLAIASLIIFGVCGAAGYLIRSYPLLVGFRALQGLGVSGVLGFGIIMIGDFFDGSTRTKALGINQAGLEASAMITPILAGMMAGRATFSPFLLYLVALPLALWMTRLPTDTPDSDVGARQHLQLSRRHLATSRSRTDFVGLLVVTVIVVGFRVGMGLTVVPFFLDKEFGVSPLILGIVVASFQPGAASAGLAAGRLRARFGLGRMVAAGLWTLALGSAVIAFATSPTVAALGMLISGAGFGLFVPAAQTWVSGVGSTAFMGVTVGIWVATNRLSQSVVPPVASFGSESIGSRTTLQIGAIVMLMLALAWRGVRRGLN